MQNLILIRGLPGSGKSTLAGKIQRGYGAAALSFEADQFFAQNGKYEFNGFRIGDAHKWCQKQAQTGLLDGFDVIVANTFTTEKELRPYFEMAHEIMGQDPVVILCSNDYGTVHNVPAQVMENMRKRFQFDVSGLYLEKNK